MRLLADENVPLPSVDALHAAGHDVASVSRDDPGAPDTQVLARAAGEDRLIITFDRDFGELVFARNASGKPGIVLLRFVPRSPTEAADLLVELLGRTDLALVGFFTVVDRDHVRQRRLPSSTPTTLHFFEEEAE